MPRPKAEAFSQARWIGADARSTRVSGIPAMPRASFSGSDAFRRRGYAAIVLAPRNRRRANSMGVRATEIRKGQVIQMDGDLLIVTDFEHKTPGNLRAIINIKTNSLTT